MAKTQGALFSIGASGTIADTVTYDKRGFARIRVIPSNPRSADQSAARLALLAVQKAIKMIGPTPKASVKGLAPVSYRWNSFLLQQAIGQGRTEYQAARDEFVALTSQQQTDWQTQGAAAGLLDRSLTYVPDDVVGAGEQLFIVSRALYDLGLNVGAGVPAGGNPAAWKAYFVS